MIRSFIWLSKKILIKLNDSFYNDNFYNKNTEKYRYAVKYFSWYHMQFLNCLENIFINNEYKELNVKFLKIDTIMKLISNECKRFENLLETLNKEKRIKYTKTSI